MNKLPSYKISNRTNILDNFIRSLILLYLRKFQGERGHLRLILQNDFVSQNILLFGQYESKSLKIIELFLKNLAIDLGDFIAFDVGANIGNHSLFFSSLFSKVYCFEPNPLVYEVLKINLNNNNNLEPVNLAISNNFEPIKLSFDKSNYGATSAYLSGEHLSSIYVDCTTLDRFVLERGLPIDKILLIKVDVEGHELPVFFGASKLMSCQRPPILIFEQLRDEFKFGSSPCIDYLRQYGYKKFLIIEKSDYIFDKFPIIIRGLVKIMHNVTFGEHYKLKQCNFFGKKDYEMIVGVPEWASNFLE